MNYELTKNFTADRTEHTAKFKHVNTITETATGITVSHCWVKCRVRFKVSPNTL